jgi:hypothetical protein
LIRYWRISHPGGGAASGDGRRGLVREVAGIPKQTENTRKRELNTAALVSLEDSDRLSRQFSDGLSHAQRSIHSRAANRHDWRWLDNLTLEQRAAYGNRFNPGL